MNVSVGAEGYLDFAVADRLLSRHGHIAVPTIGPNDRARVLKAVSRIAHADTAGRWLVLCDLDQDECAPGLIARLWPDAPPSVCLRVAVREIESWLLADPGIGSFLHVPNALIPNHPDELAAPKRRLVELARASTSRQIRSDLVPSSRSKNPIGRRYNPTMIHFVRNHWNPQRAAQRSPSLQRTLNAVQHLANP